MITVLGSLLLLFILAIALPSWAYSPPNYQEIYEVSFDAETSCLEALKDNSDLIGDCVSKTLSRIDKQKNLAGWKRDQPIDIYEEERLDQVILELTREKKEIINFTMAL